MLPNPLWNNQEKRIRALWRLFLQMVIAGICITILFLGLNGLGYRLPILISPTLIPFINPLVPLVVMGLSIWLAGRWLDRRYFSDFGLHLNSNWWRNFTFGLILGAGLMLVIFIVEFIMGWVTVTGTLFRISVETPFWVGLLQTMVLFICVGIYEELFSRGYQLRNLAEGLQFQPIGQKGGVIIAWLITSAFFGILHMGNPNASFVSTLNIFIAGLFLGLGMVLTGELAIGIGIHITWNFFQGNVFGFPVSGTTPIVSLFAIHQTGPELWTGGAFGPEAGWIGLLAILLGSLIMLLWVRHQQGNVGWHTALCSYTPFHGRHHSSGENVTPRI